MRKDTGKRISGILARYRRHNAWWKVVQVMACVVVFCTTYALILPAITLEKKPACGKEEHTHTEDCYTQVTSVSKTNPVCTLEGLSIHQHGDECQDENGQIVCGYANFIAHKHDERCYDENGGLWCTIPEKEPHTHDESCYSVPETHVHGESCYTREKAGLICTASTEPVHTHGDACYDPEKELVCTLTEGEGHAHGEGCWDESGALICTQEETEGHQHTDACYEPALTCTASTDPAHVHTDDCYEWNETLTCTASTEPQEPVLTCEKEEILLHEHTQEDCFETDKEGNTYLVCEQTQILEHVHTDACFETVGEKVDTESRTCAVEQGAGAHAHLESCYDADKNLICDGQGHQHTKLCYGTWELTCGKEEHTHTPECMVDVENEEDWKKTLPQTLSGDWREDLLAVAESQLDYTEARPDLQLGEDTRRFTRYGSWYGQPDGEWNSLFVMFCLHYAEIPEESLPQDSDSAAWVEKLAGRAEGFEKFQLYYSAEDYTPRPGDLVFLGVDEDEAVDRVGIVVKVTAATEETPAGVEVIEGDVSGKVAKQNYPMEGVEILGYAQLPEKPGEEPVEEGPLLCGREEHAHTELCSSPSPEGTGLVLTCGQEEHTHTPMCRVNVETREMWEATLPQTLSGDWAADLLAVADSQLDYAQLIRQGERNTRYGAWHGQPDGEWNTLFVMFCLHYAGIPETYLPQHSDAAAWAERLDGKADGYEAFHLYHSPEGYTPEPGDLVFLGLEEDETARRVGIVTAYTAATEETPAALETIEGDVSGKVAKRSYPMEGTRILGYAQLPEEQRTEYTWSQDGLEITAAFGPDAVLPENAQLVVERLTPDIPTPLDLMREEAAAAASEQVPDPTETASQETDSQAAASAETDSQAAASAETDSQAAASAETDSQAAAPAETDSQAAVLAEADSQEVVPAEADSQAAAPAEPDSQEVVPAEVDSQAAAPVETDSQNAAPAEMDSQETVSTETAAEEEPGKTGCIDYFRAYLAVDGMEVDPQAPADVKIQLQGERYATVSNIELIQLTGDSEQSVLAAPDPAGNLSASFTGALAGDYAVMALADATPRAGTPVAPVALQDPHKTIDAFRDGADNPDTTLDNTAADKTDLHRLYLDMQLDPQPVPIDLLLVMDQSGSMHDNYSQGEGLEPGRDMKNFDNQDIFRDEAVNLVLNGSNQNNGLVSQFLHAHADNQLAAATFQGGGRYGTNVSYDYDNNTDGDTIRNWTHTPTSVEIEGLYANSTNYCAGLLEAKRLLEDSTIKNNGHKKVMIFLSDGVPTSYIGKRQRGWPYYDTFYYRDGDGRITDTNTATATDSYFKDLLDANPDLVIHTISICADDAAPRLQTMATQGGGSCYSVSSAPELRKALSKLMYGTAYIELKVEDTLSEYVDLYEGQPDYKVTLEEADGTTLILYENGARTANGDGILKSVTYDPATKKVSAEFYPSYAPAPGSKITLSFNVETKQHAYDEYAKNGYQGVTGDVGTDYTGNGTSSTKPGFHSNTQATLTYKSDEVEGSEVYPHPVVQVAPCKIAIQKTDSQDQSKKLKGARFEIYRKAQNGETGGQPIDTLEGTYIEVVQKDRPATDENGLVVIQNLAPGDYWIVETQAPDGYKKLTAPIKITLTRGTDGKGQIVGSTETVTIDEESLSMQNVPNESWGHELPEAGGTGTEPYTIGGLLIVGLSVLLLYSKKRGKGDAVSS